MSAFTTENGIQIDDLRKIMDVCTVNSVTYPAIRAVQVEGARTFDEIVTASGACGQCEGCKTHIPWIVKFVCRCKQVSFERILEEKANGATTVDEIKEKTTAGSGCGRCQRLTEVVLATGK